MVSSGHNRWIYCLLVPEGSIKFSVLPSGIKFAILVKLFKVDQKIEPKSICRV